MGTHVDQAAVIFETKAAHVSVGCSVDETVVPPRIWFLDATDVSNCVVWLGDETGAKTRLDLPSNLNAVASQLACPEAARILVCGREDLCRIRQSSSRCRCFWRAAASSRFSSSRARAVRCRASFGVRASSCFVFSTNSGQIFEICSPSDNGWNREQLGGLPDLGVVDIWSLDRDPSESNGDLLAHVEDPLTPPSLILMERGVASPAVLKQAPKTFARSTAWSRGMRQSRSTVSEFPIYRPAPSDRPATRRSI